MMTMQLPDPHHKLLSLPDGAALSEGSVRDWLIDHQGTPDSSWQTAPSFHGSYHPHS